MRQLMIAALLLLSSACAVRQSKPSLPSAASAVAPRVVYVDRVRYVPVPAGLTDEQPVADGPLALCPSVAAGRKAGLLKANAQLRVIRAIQGTAVQP